MSRSHYRDDLGPPFLSLIIRLKTEVTSHDAGEIYINRFQTKQSSAAEKLECTLRVRVNHIIIKTSS